MDGTCQRASHIQNPARAAEEIRFASESLRQASPGAVESAHPSGGGSSHSDLTRKPAIAIGLRQTGTPFPAMPSAFAGHNFYDNIFYRSAILIVNLVGICGGYIFVGREDWDDQNTLKARLHHAFRVI